MNLHETMQQVKAIARDAGTLVMSYYNQPMKMGTKASARDIVTEADKAAEVLIVERLTALYPGHHIVGEEGGGQGAPMADADYYWYVDPIDGTTNFAGTIPYFSTSIALTDSDHNILLGVVYDPTRPEMFSAIRGSGAYLNDSPIHVSETSDMLNSLFASGFPANEDVQTNVMYWTNFLKEARGMRRLGSAALDLCYVGCGRLEGWWEGGINRWDVMAGILIVNEAGGTLSDFSGNSDPQKNNDGYYVASNTTLHPDMLRILQSDTE
ncbi:MAG: inositol monophosphatase family protein [Aggregatilineales bacterium]